MFSTQINSTKLHEGQHVMVKVIKIEDNIVTVGFLEYPGIQGLIMPNELSRKRIKNAIHATKPNKTEVCQILKIEKNNYDLSLKQVDEAEKANTLNSFKQNKLASRISEKVAKITNKKATDIYAHFSKEIEQYGTFYTFLGKVKDDLNLLERNSEINETLFNVIKQEFKASSFKIRADIDVNCYKYDGVEIIKRALDKGQEMDKNVEICLLNTPTFSITKTATDKEEGFATVQRVIDAIKENIVQNGGAFHLMAEPKIFGEKNKHNMLKVSLEEMVESTSSDSD